MATIVAPVAGTLLKNVFAEGAAVTNGKTAVIIEALKMEIEIKAQNDGVIHYLAAPKSQVTAGQPLAEIN